MRARKEGVNSPIHLALLLINLGIPQNINTWQAPLFIVLPSALSLPVLVIFSL